MKINLMKIGLTTLGLSLVGLIVGTSLVLLMSCFYTAKWICLKVWGILF
jgi:hypothetical protein